MGVFDERNVQDDDSLSRSDPDPTPSPCGRGLGRGTRLFILCLLLLTTVSILIWLGFWQLHRADEKRKLLSDYQQRFHQSPSTFTETPALYQAIKIQGTPQKPSLLLDNQFYQHRIGFQIITPVEIAKDKPWVLVNRGWIAANASRQNLPEILPLPQQVSWQGNIYFSAKKTLLLQAESKQGPIIERLDFPAIAKKIGHPIYPFVLLLAATEADAYVRDWQPVVMPPERHIAYAVQWFGLALVFLIGFIVVMRKTRSGATSI